VATHPTESPIRWGDTRLAPFSSAMLERVASWAADPHDAFLVAPQTPPPITADSVRAWVAASTHPYLLLRNGAAVAYGELNLLREQTRRWWLGHLLVDPALRGRRLGRILVQHLLRVAFREHAASAVTLVVFPGNETAIKSYQAAGMTVEGFEFHYFTPYQQRSRMLRMVAYARTGWPRPRSPNR
jgi:ribosomal protein S18 acetylase RimI-like enzyme